MPSRRAALVLVAIAGCSSPAATSDGDAAGPGPDGAVSHWIDRCAALAPTYAAPEPPAPLRTLYVDGTTGDDARSGLSAADAWRTLAKANAAVQAGDLVVMSGAFTDDAIAPRASGTTTDPIVYRAAQGAAPSLTITADLTAINLAGRSFVV